MKRSRIGRLAEHLIREGHVDNEADARLAAVHIILALDSRGGGDDDDDDDEPDEARAR